MGRKSFMKAIRKMFGGADGQFGVGDALQSAALVGTGAYLAKQNPDSSVIGVVATATKYAAYFFGGLLIFFIIFIIGAVMFGKPAPTPPADTTDSASGK
jgi:hypothetical protein